MKQLIEELEGIGAIFDAMSDQKLLAAEIADVEHVADCDEIVIRTKWETTNLTIQCEASGQGVAERIKRLKRAKAPRRSKVTPISQLKLARGKFSQKTYDQFVADGELENAEQYRNLWK